MNTLRRRVAYSLAVLAKRLVRLGAWIDPAPVRLPTDDDYARFEAWDAAWQREKE